MTRSAHWSAVRDAPAGVDAPIARLASVPWCHRHDAVSWQLRAFVQRFFVALLVIAVFTAGGIGMAYWSRPTRSTRQDREVRPGHARPTSAAASPRNYLIIGSDTRAFVNDATDAEHFGDPATADRPALRHDHGRPHRSRTATPGCSCRSRATCGSTIPGTARAKINAAFNGGPQLVDRDDRAGLRHPDQPLPRGRLRRLPQHRGRDRHGADLLPDAGPRQEDRARRSTTPGASDLDGEQALAYVRSRYYEYDRRTAKWHDDPTSDLGRIQRQQYFIRSLAQRGGEVAAFRERHEGQRHARQDGRRTSRATRTSGSPTSVALAYDVPRRRPGGVRDVHAAGDAAVHRRPGRAACSTTRRRRRSSPACAASGTRPHADGARRRRAGRRSTSRSQNGSGRRRRGAARRSTRCSGAGFAVVGAARRTPTAATTRHRGPLRARAREDQGAVRARVPRRRGQARRARHAPRRAPTSCSCSAATSTQVDGADDDDAGRRRDHGDAADDRSAGQSRRRRHRAACGLLSSRHLTCPAERDWPCMSKPQPALTWSAVP